MDGQDDLIAEFSRVLALESVERNFFRGEPMVGARGRTYGGLVISQALMAATRTVEPEKAAHSLHGYFMRGGDATAPVLYRVERDRDGRSFATRRVVAIQDGQPILNLAASFHKAEPGFEHQDEMPEVPGPDELKTDTELAEENADQLPADFLEFMRRPRPVELRPVDLRPPFRRGKQPPRQSVWLRVGGRLADDPALHRVALAFASDFTLLATSILSHDRAYSDRDIMTASLDHAVWLHDDFRADDWLLYVMDSPWAGGARGFNRGRFFTRDGRLVAEAAQEGLIRPITPRE